ncbi:MAG TPA: TIGR03435 family protein [Bryobacteraceae bacterium]|jgi:uncharacterized protein (TIGR03435 family)
MSGLPAGSLSGSDSSRFSAQNITLNLLIRLAWNVREYQVLGGPSWLGSNRFDIAAKPETPVDNDQMMLMLQNLLQDRFKLAIRRETKEMPAWVLIPAKNGLRLHAGECAVGEPALRCRGLRIFVNGLDGQASMPLFINVLSDLVGRPVIDDTKFSGPFDVHLLWTPDGSTPGDRSGDSLPLPDGTAPSFFTAIEEQLGIKVESRKASVETLTIEHAEKPVGNQLFRGGWRSFTRFRAVT